MKPKTKKTTGRNSVRRHQNRARELLKEMSLSGPGATLLGRLMAGKKLSSAQVEQWNALADSHRVETNRAASSQEKAISEQQRAEFRKHTTKRAPAWSHHYPPFRIPGDTVPYEALVKFSVDGFSLRLSPAFTAQLIKLIEAAQNADLASRRDQQLAVVALYKLAQLSTDCLNVLGQRDPGLVSPLASVVCDWPIMVRTETRPRAFERLLGFLDRIGLGSEAPVGSKPSSGRFMELAVLLCRHLNQHGIGEALTRETFSKQAWILLKDSCRHYGIDPTLSEFFTHRSTGERPNGLREKNSRANRMRYLKNKILRSVWRLRPAH
jgi:hypothetical protein